MSVLSLRISPAKAAFWATFTIAMTFAVYTQHAWEDYYITFRLSKNLATGHGLVFNVGDRLHAFTSPLGVLLPAVSYLLTGNSSDAGALWIYRLMSCAALGGAAALLLLSARRQNYGPLAGFFLVAWLATDAKTVDFSINGMETGWLVLFLAYALWAHLSAGPRQWLHLGAAWAGLMWSRPDSFIYIGLLAAGFWLFNDPLQTGTTRGRLLGLFLRAGAVTTALYLPWLLLAWGYYGTPIPHTITAKTGFGDPRTLAGLVRVALMLPLGTGLETNTLKDTFLPAYYMIGGWPAELPVSSRSLATCCGLLWLLPFLRVETRAASLAFFGGHAYLSYYPYFPFPWYLPSTTLLAIFCLGSVLAQVGQAARQWQAAEPASGRPRHLLAVAVVAATLLLGVGSWITWQTAREFAAQQKYVEDGNRRKIGEWLHANAKPGQSVFLEPLGYIGYFSGLKTYDFPGMSSREMVEARQKVGVDWVALIQYLQPSWLVLRPQEIARLNTISPVLLSSYYLPVKEFSVADELRGLDVMGRPYLEYDSRFIVFRQQKPVMEKTEIAETSSQFDVSRQTIDGLGVTLVHAPGRMVVKVPPAAATVEVGYGFPPGAYSGPGPKTDGATFRIIWEGDGRSETLFDVVVDPVNHPEQRKLLHFESDLPRSKDAHARLVFLTLPGETSTNDWTCWSLPEFQKAR